MAYGLQTYRSNGTLALDTSVHRLNRLVGTYNMSVPYSNWYPSSFTNLYIPGISNDGTWSAIVNVIGTTPAPPIYAINEGYISLGNWWLNYAMNVQVVVFRN